MICKIKKGNLRGLCLSPSVGNRSLKEFVVSQTGYLTPVSGFLRYQNCMWYIDIHTGKTLIHICFLERLRMTLHLIGYVEMEKRNEMQVINT